MFATQLAFEHIDYSDFPLPEEAQVEMLVLRPAASVRRSSVLPRLDRVFLVDPVSAALVHTSGGFLLDTFDLIPTGRFELGLAVYHLKLAKGLTGSYSSADILSCCVVQALGGAL